MSDADVVYYNLSIGNNNYETAGDGSYKEVNAKIDADNNIPILHNPDEYYGCIIRFQLPMITTPLISFFLATKIYELTSSIFFELKKSLITSALILNSFPILIKISLFPISRPSIKYD